VSQSIRFTVSVEEIEDVDAPKPPHEDWSGEETFWICEGEEDDEAGWEDDIHHWSAPIDVEDDDAEEAAFNSWPQAYVFAPT